MAATPRLQQRRQLLPTLQRGSSDRGMTEDRTFKTQARNSALENLPLQYVAHDGGTLPAGLSDSPESESRNLSC